MTIIDFLTRMRREGQEARETMMACWSSLMRPEIFLSPMTGSAQTTVQTLHETCRHSVTVKIHKRLMKMS